MVQKAGRRKVLAVLAGGLVLGVGAAATLAAWNDSEFATGDFAAGEFVFQGSVDNATWADHTSEAGAAELSFEAGADRLSPGDDVYEAYALRVTGSYDAALQAADPVGSGDFAAAGKLSFAAVSTAEFGCDAAAFDGGGAVPGTVAAGDDVYLCLRVSAEDALEQGDAGSVTWQWNAESVQ